VRITSDDLPEFLEHKRGAVEITPARSPEPPMQVSFEEYVASQIENGTLVRVLEDWCPPFHGTSSTTRAGSSNGRAISTDRGRSHVDPLRKVSEGCLHIWDPLSSSATD